MFNSDSIFVWADGDFCYFEELDEMLLYKSDDFEVITEQEAIVRGLIEDV